MVQDSHFQIWPGWEMAGKRREDTMKATMTLLLGGIVILSGCSNPADKSSGNGDGNPVSSVIDAQGGSVTAGNLSITVPSGAFDSKVTLRMSVSNESAFTVDGISETFRIEGIPASFAKPLEIRVRCDSLSSGQGCIAIGEDVFSHATQAAETAYRLISAEKKGDYLVCTLPPPEESAVTAKKTDDSDDSGNTIHVQAVTGYGPLTSASGHFEIEYPSRTVSRSDVERLAADLEDAFQTFQTMGFSYAARSNWPVKVTVIAMGGESYGSYYNSTWGNNYGYMEFNSQKIGSGQEIRITAGHEFFHLVQSLYDPRNRLSKAKLGGPGLWLDEACAVWAEGKFSSDPNYSSPIREGHQMAPFEGLTGEGKDNVSFHGYGESALIKYLVSENSERILVQIYERIIKGDDPVTAVLAIAKNQSEWWEPFLRKYLLGEIYATQLSVFTGNRSGFFPVKTSADTLRTFSGKYPDLSGQFYTVALNNPNLDESARIECTAIGGMNEITLFKFKSGTIQYLASAPDAISVTGMKKLNDEGWNLLVMVSNSRAATPFTGQTDITLKIRVTSAAQLPYTHIDIFLHVTCRVHYSDGTELVELCGIREIRAGSFQNGLFAADWDSTADLPSTSEVRKGNVSVMVDPATLKVSSFTLNSDILFMDKNHNIGSSQTIYSSGKGVQLQKTDYYTMETNIYGKETAAYVNEFTEQRIYINQLDYPNVVSVTPEYADTDYIKIRFWF